MTGQDKELMQWHRLAHVQGLIVVAEDAEIRPAAMRYQKPSEIVENLLYRLGYGEQRKTRYRVILTQRRSIEIPEREYRRLQSMFANGNLNGNARFAIAEQKENSVVTHFFIASEIKAVEERTADGWEHLDEEDEP